MADGYRSDESDFDLGTAGDQDGHMAAEANLHENDFAQFSGKDSCEESYESDRFGNGPSFEADGFGDFEGDAFGDCGEFFGKI